MPQKKKRCQFQDTKAARSRDTPSYSAKNCPGTIKSGKVKATNGGPQLYISRAKLQCAKRPPFGCKTVWKWVEYDAKPRAHTSCEFQNTKSMRVRDTPSWIAKDCPWLVRPGKKKGVGGRPKTYVSTPRRQCSRRSGCRYIWKWIAQ
jgi:hypothetical protein